MGSAFPTVCFWGFGVFWGFFFDKTKKICLKIHVEESIKQVLDITSLLANMKFSEKILLISMILMGANQVNKKLVPKATKISII